MMKTTGSKFVKYFSIAFIASLTFVVLSNLVLVSGDESLPTDKIFENTQTIDVI